MILFIASPQGWPLALVNASHDGAAPPGHVAFETMDGMVSWKDANEDKRPQPPPTPEPVPASVPKWAFLLVIRKAGKEAALKSTIAGYSGPNADRVRAKWEADPDIERNGATINSIGAAIGYTPEQVDQVFRDAEKEANQ